MDAKEMLSGAGVVPVIVIDDVSKAVPLARALVDGGLNVLEVTFRTQCAAEAIAKIRAEVPEAVAGAGTILDAEQLQAAKAAGARFCVAPGFVPETVRAAIAADMPFCPGVATASELSQALALGCRMVKFFPAESAGGAKYIKDLLGAFRWTGVGFMPTGGVNPANLKTYLSIPEVVCCGGTWIAPKDAVASGDWARIAALAAEAKKLAAESRG